MHATYVILNLLVATLKKEWLIHIKMKIFLYIWLKHTMNILTVQMFNIYEFFFLSESSQFVVGFYIAHLSIHRPSFKC